MPMEKLIDDIVDASGLDADTVGDTDRDFVEAGLKDLVAGLRARRAWEDHIGAILTHSQTLELTGWTKQALSQAVRDNRALRLRGSNGGHGYAAAVFNEDRPARPILGIKDVLRVWAAADPRGWMAASWLGTSQPELGGRTPREALLDGDVPAVIELAHQATERLAA